jgi:alkyl sulfatase BDS1-like metallo-beta-lactamase superfamily hydrolase
MRANLNAGKAKGNNIAVNFTDTEEQFNFEVRNQVAIFSDGLNPNAKSTLKLDKMKLFSLMGEKITVDDNQIEGEKGDVKTFLSLFEKMNPKQINLIR